MRSKKACDKTPPVNTFADLRRSAEPELSVSEWLPLVLPFSEARKHVARQLAFCERILKGAPPG